MTMSLLYKKYIKEYEKVMSNQKLKEHLKNIKRQLYCSINTDHVDESY